MLALLLIVFLVAVNAFYVTAEYSVVGVGTARAQRLVREKRRGARWLAPMVLDVGYRDRVITACQLGISGSSLILGAYAQMVLAPALAPVLSRWSGWGVLTAHAVAAGLLLVGISSVQIVFGEQLPKTMAIRDPARWALVTALPLRFSTLVFAGFIVFLTAASNLILRLLRLPVLPERSLHSAAEIDWLVGHSKETGAVHRDLGDRLQNALNFAGRVARDVMVPRVRVVAVPENITLEELRKKVSESDYTRLPVYRDSLDTIIGLVHAKDVLLRTAGPGPVVSLADLIRPLPLFPWGTKGFVLLEAMRARQAAMVVILDERGGTAGIVTLEDLLEEVFGEVEDEFDPVGPELGKLQDGRFRLRAEDSISAVNERYGLELRSREARTVGGLLMETLARVARPGDSVQVDDVLLQVERVSGRRIETIMAIPLPPRKEPS